MSDRVNGKRLFRRFIDKSHPSTPYHELMLSVRSLTKTYTGAPPRTVLNNVSLTLNQGANLAIMGESGSGKSTLLNLIAGLDRPDAGQIFIDEVEMTNLAEPVRTLVRRERIGFVFQAFHLLPHLSIEDNVGLPLALNQRPESESRARVTEMLKAVGLLHRAGDFPHQLSGGESQRVAVARALVHRPKLILADEPTGNLDADNASDTLELLRAQCREAGAALLLVTHSLTAARLMDDVLVLNAQGLERLE